MHTARSLLYRGVFLTETPWTETPLDIDPPPDSDPPVNKITDRCKKHYLPATSFAGGKNVLVVSGTHYSAVFELVVIGTLCTVNNWSPSEMCTCLRKLPLSHSIFFE